MKRRSAILLALVVPCLAAVVWLWFLRPYDWHPDPGARATIRFTRVERDHSFYWVDIYLRLRPDEEHDLLKPVRLLTASGRELEPADTTLEGTAERKIEALSLRFWLDQADLEGPLRLRINDGELVVRKGSGLPALENGDAVFRQTAKW